MKRILKAAICTVALLISVFVLLVISPEKVVFIFFEILAAAYIVSITFDAFYKKFKD